MHAQAPPLNRLIVASCYNEAMIASANIVFFSGTGCTAQSARALKDSLEKLDIGVRVEELRGPISGTPAIDEDVLILMYPLYTFNAPLPIYEYVDHLEGAKEQKVALVPVSGGGDVAPNRACRLGIRRELERKGYAVVYESMIVMPCNVIVYTPEPAAKALLEKLPSRCDEIARDISKGVVLRIDPPLTDRLFSKIGDWEKGYWGRIRFSEKLAVSDTCVSCGLCAQTCPRKNIDMVEGLPRFRDDCVMCLNCIYGCPEKAISAGCGSFLVLKNGFRLSEYRTASAVDEERIVPLLKGALWKGVRRYLFG